MINPIALGQTIKYVLPEDKENPTIWLLGALDSITRSRIISESVSFDTTDFENPKFSPNIKPFEQDIMIVKLGLKGFENFNVPFKTEKKTILGMEQEVVSEETIKAIPQSVIHQLSMEIWKENLIGEEEEKN